MADEEYFYLADIIAKRAEDQKIISDEHGNKTSYISLLSRDLIDHVFINGYFSKKISFARLKPTEQRIVYGKIPENFVRSDLFAITRNNITVALNNQLVICDRNGIILHNAEFADCYIVQLKADKNSIYIETNIDAFVMNSTTFDMVKVGYNLCNIQVITNLDIEHCIIVGIEKHVFDSNAYKSLSVYEYNSDESSYECTRRVYVEKIELISAKYEVDKIICCGYALELDKSKERHISDLVNEDDLPDGAASFEYIKDIFVMFYPAVSDIVNKTCLIDDYDAIVQTDSKYISLYYTNYPDDDDSDYDEGWDGDDVSCDLFYRFKLKVDAICRDGAYRLYSKNKDTIYWHRNHTEIKTIRDKKYCSLQLGRFKSLGDMSDYPTYKKRNQTSDYFDDDFDDFDPQSTNPFAHNKYGLCFISNQKLYFGNIALANNVINLYVANYKCYSITEAGILITVGQRIKKRITISKAVAKLPNANIFVDHYYENICIFSQTEGLFYIYEKSTKYSVCHKFDKSNMPYELFSCFANLYDSQLVYSKINTSEFIPRLVEKTSDNFYIAHARLCVVIYKDKRVSSANPAKYIKGRYFDGGSYYSHIENKLYIVNTHQYGYLK